MAALMKGHTWRDYSHKMTYPCYVEAKYDEIRCQVKVVEGKASFLSYSEKPLANMQKFAGYFETLSRVSGYTEFDCGFEVNGNFNDSYRWVRSTKKLPDDLHNAQCKFMLYDLPECRRAYEVRILRMDEVLRWWSDWCSAMHTPMTMPERKLCDTPAEVELAYLDFIHRGLEGAMVKEFDHLYERKRSYSWLKMKPEEDADGVVESINMAWASVDDPVRGVCIGDPLGRAGSLVVRMADGSTAEPHGIRHDLGRDMIENPQAYIGQWCEFKYMERDRQGGYRHPRFHRLREAK